jgi:hypothetical protein
MKHSFALDDQNRAWIPDRCKRILCLQSIQAGYGTTESYSNCSGCSIHENKTAGALSWLLASFLCFGSEEFKQCIHPPPVYVHIIYRNSFTSRPFIPLTMTEIEDIFWISVTLTMSLIKHQAVQTWSHSSRHSQPKKLNFYELRTLLHL